MRPHCMGHPVLVFALFALVACPGCMQSLFNSWLEPGAVGHFSREGTTEIRTTLSIQDSPMGIPGATDPQPEDLIPRAEEYRFGSGDTMMVRILDLLARDTETPITPQVDELGNIRLPIVGSVHAAGLSARELEEEIADYLQQKDILLDAQVIIEPQVRRNATYTVFGAIAGPNIYPLPTPDFSLLEALNIAGGLADAVNSVYVFREEEPGPGGQADLALPPPGLPYAGGPAEPAYLASHAGGSVAWGAQGRSAPDGQVDPPNDQTPPDADEQARREMIEAIVASDTQPATRQAGQTQPAEEAPIARSRWIFLNGKWIEIEPAPSPPTAGQAETMPTTTRAQPPEFPSQPEPSIDWSQIAEERRQRIIHVSAEALRTGDPRQNIIVRRGDTIRVAAGESGEYYMMGQINRPGPYALTGRRLTLKTAIAAAGNLGPLAWPQRCTVYRRLGDREEMIQVDVDRIFSGKDPDFYVKKDDLIVFGTHPASMFLAVLRNAFRLTYGFGFVYDRNFSDVDNIRRQVDASTKAQARAQQRNQFPGLFP